MRRIGIVFALSEELEEFLKIVELKKEYEIFDLKFYECNLKELECILVESGIGKVNSARATQILIDNMLVDCIVNIGVAGSLSKDVNICDIVVGEKLVQHDFDLTAFNREKGFIPNVGKYIECDEYLVKKSKSIKPGTKVHYGNIASGDIFVTDEKMANKINSKFNALCTEMEGAAIAQVCYLSHIPFIVIRAISDSPNGNNGITYDEFLKLSSKMVSNYLLKLLLLITK